MSYELKAEKVRSRINEALKIYKLTENSVASGDSAVQSRLNSQLSHGKKITLDTVLRIIDAAPEISTEWLLRGTGEIHLSRVNGVNNVTTGRNTTVIGQQNGGASSSHEEYLKQIIAEKDKQIAALISLLK